jgi:hypothetical protein
MAELRAARLRVRPNNWVMMEISTPNALTACRISRSKVAILLQSSRSHHNTSCLCMAL